AIFSCLAWQSPRCPSGGLPAWRRWIRSARRPAPGARRSPWRAAPEVWWARRCPFVVLGGCLVGWVARRRRQASVPSFLQGEQRSLWWPPRRHPYTLVPRENQTATPCGHQKDGAPPVGSVGVYV
ncbi:unnamed protein product, partial [Amoebophrya sp. A120]